MFDIPKDSDESVRDAVVEKLSNQSVTIPALLIYLALALFVGGGTGSIISGVNESRLGQVEKDIEAHGRAIKELTAKHGDLMLILTRLEGSQALTNQKLDTLVNEVTKSGNLR